MKKKIVYLVSFLLFIFIIFVFNTTSYAGSQKLKSINYDTVLNEDGSADITETWNIKVTDTNTLFKTFELDNSKYGSITNIKVSEITETGNEIQFTNTNEYAYHVKKNGFYALQTKASEFEIAWGVSIDETENKIYKIKYRIQDAVKTYADCSEFYWQFIGKSNGIPADEVTGTIHLPKAVSSRENLKVWAHGPLDGNINIIDNRTVRFEVESLNTETMVEARVVTTEEIFPNNLNTYSYNEMQNILEEEQKWADEANNQRKIALAIIISICLVILAIAIFLICKIIKYIKMLSSLEKERTKPEQEYDYFREIPNENATPAEASFLYYFDKKQLFKANLPKIVSATMLDLALKKAISFEKTEKDEMIIIINNTEGIELKADEMSIYEMLKKVYNYTLKKSKKEDIRGITVKNIEKYARNNDTTFLGKVEGLEKIVTKSEETNGNYDKELIKKSDKRRDITAIYIIFGIICIMAFWLILPLILGILFIVCAILNNKVVEKMRMLTQKGVNEQAKWKALKKYMEEYSLLKEREVPELVLWEKYLVYATAFGIADKVLGQLKVTYPEINDESYMIANGYTYMYMMNRINFESSITGGIQKAYNAGISARAARNYSSGGGRRWRILWTAAEAGGRWPDGMGRKIEL